MLVSDNYANPIRRSDGAERNAHGGDTRRQNVSRRSLTIAGVALVLIVATGFGFYVRATAGATPGYMALAGDVRVEDFTVRAPVVTNPTPDYTVGVTSTPAPKKPASAGPPSRGVVVSGFLSEMLVTEGSRVTTGQALARLDTTMLDLGVASAKAGAVKMRASVEVLEHTVTKLRDARAKLLKARAQLIPARASLLATYTVMLKGRAALRSQIKAIEALIAQPGGPPPHVPPYPILLAGMKSAETSLSAGIRAVHTALATMSAGLAKIATGLSQMDSGLHQLRDAHRLAVVGIRAQDTAVALAEARRTTATVTSPVSGIVTFVRIPGTAVMAGAPLVRIRPDLPVRVDTYLTTDQLAQVAIGTPALVDFDSNPGGELAGHVTVIGSTAVVPPTGFPTAIVHMTRAVKVTIELDGGATAPAGTPVDVKIRAGSVR